MKLFCLQILFEPWNKPSMKHLLNWFERILKYKQMQCLWWHDAKNLNDKEQTIWEFSYLGCYIWTAIWRYHLAYVAFALCWESELCVVLCISSQFENVRVCCWIWVESRVANVWPMLIHAIKKKTAAMYSSINHGNKFQVLHIAQNSINI